MSKSNCYGSNTALESDSEGERKRGGVFESEGRVELRLTVCLACGLSFAAVTFCHNTLSPHPSLCRKSGAARILVGCQRHKGSAAEVNLPSAIF